jgi:putative transposase
VVTDGAPGLIRAVETCFPRALRQRCLVHRLRNLHSKAPDRQWPEIAIRARACYEAASPALATLLREDFVQAYGRELPTVVQCFTDDFDACIVETVREDQPALLVRPAVQLRLERHRFHASAECLEG